MRLLQVENAFLMSAVAAVLGSALFMASFIILEPVVGRAAIDEFVVSQSITGEISFNASTTDVTMSPAIAGLTGGTSNGTTDVVVTTNNNTGYNMTIQFASATAMYRTTGGGQIANYNPASVGVPDQTFANEVYGQFAYSAYSATEGTDIDPSFKGAGCAGGASVTLECWMNPSSTAAETIVNRSSATTAAGATTTVQFRVGVPASPSPAIPTGTYTATATLTAVTNP